MAIPGVFCGRRYRDPANCKEALVSRTLCMFGLASLLTLSTATHPQQPKAPAADYPSWAFPLKVERPLAPQGPEPGTLADSPKRYTQQQVDDLLNPPDWFPDRRPDPPAIVLQGHGDALACGACHLMSGLGHPESTDLTGLSVTYLHRAPALPLPGRDAKRRRGCAHETGG